MGQIMTWQVMTQTEDAMVVMIKMVMIQIVLPALLTLLFSEYMRKKKWIRYGDMKLDL